MSIQKSGTKIYQGERVFDLYAELPKDEKTLKEHVISLSRMAKVREHRELFDHLYECLSILDSKSQSLLAFNAIIIAVFSIFLTRIQPIVELVTIGIGLVSILISSFLLLSVIWVHWSTTEHLNDPNKHAVTLLNIRRSRTIKFRLAWYCAVTSIILLCGFFIIVLCRIIF